MKKSIALLLVLCMIFALGACGQKPAPAPAPTEAPAEQPAEQPVEEPVEEPAEENPVMTFAEYDAAEIDAPVVIEASVQATQSWWNDQITVYAADPDGAYFIYNMACSEEDAAKLVPGQKIRVTGVKAEWAGEVEIVDASFEFVDGEGYIAEPVDATPVWGTVDMIGYMNQLVSFKGLTVEAYDDSGAAFAYKDPVGQTDDLYFKVTLGDTTYEFCVEFYLCGKDTPVYEAVEALQVGDKIDVEGFLYWYNGPNLQATMVSPAASDLMNYADYTAAAVDDPVSVEVCVQATQSWWNDQITVYAADPDGAYFIYNMACSEEDAAKLVPGQWILVNGFKSEWSGEVEIVDASFEFVDKEAYIAEPADATETWGKDDEMIAFMNQLVTFTDVTVEAYDDSGAAFAYKDPEGKTDDLYFKVSKDGTTYEFCVEFYLCGKDTDVYKAVEALKVGDVIDLTGFLYWYNGPNLQATALTMK